MPGTDGHKMETKGGEWEVLLIMARNHKKTSLYTNVRYITMGYIIILGLKTIIKQFIMADTDLYIVKWKEFNFSAP